MHNAASSYWKDFQEAHVGKMQSLHVPLLSSLPSHFPHAIVNFSSSKCEVFFFHINICMHSICGMMFFF
ncbi:hypothetical protein JHK86_005082 [Glycine max]|nr:hypothetical protein JHK86_005082 [Glycine max]